MLCVNLGLYDFDEIECLDTILNRYHDVNYVMDLSFFDGIKLIQKFNEKITEQKIWEMWNIEHVWMDEDNYVSFEDYKNKALGKKTNKNKITKEELKKRKEEAMAKAEQIRKQFKNDGYITTT